MKKILLITLAVFALSSQAGNFQKNKHNWNNGSNMSFEAAIARAEAGYKDVLKLEMAWRDTGDMIKKAKKLNKDGKESAAITLANRAYKQTVNAKKQATVAPAGPRF